MPVNDEGGDPLHGRWFRITRIVEHGEDVPIVERRVPTIWFLKGNIFAETGVNRIRAEYDIDAEGRLIAGDIRKTLVGTGGAFLDQQRRFERAFAARPQVVLSGDGIVLKAEGISLHGAAIPPPG